MKKKIQYLPVALAIGTVTLLISCNSGSDKTDNASNSMQNTDMSVHSSTPPDTAMANNKKDTMNDKKMPAAKNKKGKITVMQNEVPGGTAMKMDKMGYYSNVEVWPSFPTGQNGLGNFFDENIEYPEAATDNGTEGMVKVGFDVDDKGMIHSPKIISAPVGDGIDAEALRVVNKMPAWVPGKIKGKDVKTHVILPISFRLF